MFECFLSFILYLTKLGHIESKFARYCLVWEGFGVTVQLCAYVILDSQDKLLDCWRLGWVNTWAELSHGLFPIFCTSKWTVSSSCSQNWSLWPLSKSFRLYSSCRWKNASLNHPPATYVKVLFLNWSFLPPEEKLKLFCLPHQNSDDKHRERLDVFIVLFCLNSTFNKSCQCKFLVKSGRRRSL